MSRRGRTMPTDWQQTRTRILERDGGLCRIAGPRCARVATQVDHVVPAWRGGSEDDSNLQSVCGPCHRSKTASDAARAVPSRKRPVESHPGFK